MPSSNSKPAVTADTRLLARYFDALLRMPNPPVFHPRRADAEPPEKTTPRAA